MYVTMTEKCLCCGGEVAIGMPCGQPCKQYPVAVTTTTNTKGDIMKDDYFLIIADEGAAIGISAERTIHAHGDGIEGSGLCLETAGEG